MAFSDVLRRRLGPMASLVGRFTPPDVMPPDPGRLFYRRAVGLEVRVRPDETWASVELGRSGTAPENYVRLSMAEAKRVLALSDWHSAEAIGMQHGLSPGKLWRWVEQDLLFYCRYRPKARLTGDGGVLERAPDGARIARRASAWPTVAVETAVAIQPMPFMPRGGDLRGAEMVGLRFASLERGHEVLGVTITGSPRIGALFAELLPRLDGRLTRRGLLEQLRGSRVDLQKVLAFLDAATVLEVIDGPLPAASAFERSEAYVAWLGHAGALLNAGGRRILVDPLYFSMSAPESPWVWPEKLDPRAIPSVDAVFITHGDNDHLNPNTLAFVPRHVPVYVPRVGASPPPYQVDILGILRVLGFKNVTQLAPGDSTEVGRITATAFPFVGESWDLELAKVTYLFEAPEVSVFFSADSAAMPATYRALAERPRPVDLAFMGVSGCAESFVMPPGLGYGNFYADWVPRTRRNEWVQHCAGPEEAAASVELFGPRFAFGYAAGGASYVRTEYSDVGDHDRFAARLATARTRPVALPLGRPILIRELSDLPALSCQRENTGL